MSDSSLRDACLPQVQAVAQDHGWQLPPPGLALLADSILPYVELILAKEAGAEMSAVIRQVAVNYYLDGPQVRLMCMSHSREGDECWRAWREAFVQWARGKVGRGVQPDEVEDLAQDTSERARKALPNFRFQCRLSTFLRGVFINSYKKWIDQDRRKRGPERCLEEDDPRLVYEQDWPEPRGEVDWLARVRSQIIEIVQSENYEILHLYYGERTFTDETTGRTKKWTDRAIGEKLGKPTNTITAKRRRALARLKKDAGMRRLFNDLLGLGAANPDE